MCERESIYNEGANEQRTAGPKAMDERRVNEGETRQMEAAGEKAVEEMQRVAKNEPYITGKVEVPSRAYRCLMQP